MTPTPSRFRLTLAIAAGVIVALALVAAGCGGSGSSSDASGTTGTTSTTATPSSNGSRSSFAECLKENGVEGFDPGSSSAGWAAAERRPGCVAEGDAGVRKPQAAGPGLRRAGPERPVERPVRKASVVLEEARHRELLAGLRAERRRSAEAAGGDAGLRRPGPGRCAARGRKWRAAGGSGSFAAFSRCMRNRGIVLPGAGSGTPTDTTSAKYKLAQKACQPLLNGSEPVSGSESRGRLWFNLMLVVVVAAGAVGAYFLIGSNTSAASASTRTTSASKGVVLSTVSASGNVKACRAAERQLPEQRRAHVDHGAGRTEGDPRPDSRDTGLGERREPGEDCAGESRLRAGAAWLSSRQG